MSIDLCGGFLAGFLLSELLPVVSQHPRFRTNDGQGLIQFSNLVSYNDVSMAIGGIRSDGRPMSPDNFMTTLMGRVCAAKLEGFNGGFLEWIQETGTDSIPGLYYLSIDQLDEGTREVRAVMEAYRWLEGRKENAVGSCVSVDSSIPKDAVAPVDPTVVFHRNGAGLTILSYTPDLQLHRTDTGSVLVPGTDWWLERQEQQLLVTSLGGRQGGITLPPDLLSFRLLEEGQFELRQGQDWDWETENTIRLAAWTRVGINIYVDGIFRRIPQGSNYIHPENYVTAPLAVEEEVVADQSSYALTRGIFHDYVWAGDQACFRNLMDLGDRARWEIRIKRPQVYVHFHKMAVNPDFIPGLSVAVGDRVELGDRIALIVFPQRCETYEVFGSKESVTFDIVVKSNDLMTSTELAGLVRNYLLVHGRTRLEAAGLSIQSVSSSTDGAGQRDASGTTSTFPVTLSVSGMADWEVHTPLVNRVDDIDIAFGPPLVEYPGSPRVLGVVSAFGGSQFTPAYQ